MSNYRLYTRICLVSLSVLMACYFARSVYLAQQPEPATGVSTEPQRAVFTEYQKESLTAIKEMTSNLLFLAVGVFALVGGYLSKEAVGFEGKGVLKCSFICFGSSLLAGLIVYMALIEQLQAQDYDPNSRAIRIASIIQITAVGTGAILFYLFLRKNIK
jgi:hypothetical protein